MNNLRTLRERKRLTLKEVGTKVGIDFSALSKIERGEQQLNEAQAVMLADFFKVSLDTLFRRDFEQAERLIFKEQPITYETVLSKLHTFSNQELVRIIGAAEGTLQARSDSLANEQYTTKPTVDLQKKQQT